MDYFEKHIRDNKALFDEHRADRAKMWAKIELELSNTEPKVVPLWKSPLFKVAASVVLLLLLSFLIGITVYGSFQQGGQSNVVSQELMDIDMHYSNLVQHQVQLVKDHPDLSQEDKKEFLSFMDELDEEYEVLKLEMQKNLGNERVLEAIIGNYKKRIELIENLLRQINDSKMINDDYGYTL
ncbi:hypothetical protein SAMN03080594_108134 [Arenibacter palladensis]|uniref:Anti-sigma factor n=1 Tax=Arenibacter palladensis TaxID=237373 RepID=A0A1M5F412_9FLAO|nr:hypothetical protein [Arenibacter palladensis]SHF86205.1 hypothetical protein SAMN03080594_108134 [Arenibacter palladensis]